MPVVRANPGVDSGSLHDFPPPLLPFDGQPPILAHLESSFLECFLALASPPSRTEPGRPGKGLASASGRPGREDSGGLDVRCPPSSWNCHGQRLNEEIHVPPLEAANLARTQRHSATGSCAGGSLPGNTGAHSQKRQAQQPSSLTERRNAPSFESVLSNGVCRGAFNKLVGEGADANRLETLIMVCGTGYVLPWLGARGVLSQDRLCPNSDQSSN